MPSILILAEESKPIAKLCSELVRKGYDCSMSPAGEDIMAQFVEKAPDLVLVETDSFKIKHPTASCGALREGKPPHPRLRTRPLSSRQSFPGRNGYSAETFIKTLSQRIKRETSLPIIALVHREMLDVVDTHPGIDDFVIQPYNVNELELRIKRLLHNTRSMDSGELIRCGDLIIDLARYEVSIGGKLIMLTFKEYELLKFLASNRGRVFTREALLNKVWSHDYYGGDRTVDVHIRRLRSKLEDSSHIFIETVRNIGYKFRVKEPASAT